MKLSHLIFGWFLGLLFASGTGLDWVEGMERLHQPLSFGGQAQIYYDEARTKVSRGDLVGADRAYSRSIAYEPQFLKAYAERAALRCTLDREAEAASDFERANLIAEALQSNRRFALSCASSRDEQQS